MTQKTWVDEVALTRFLADARSKNCRDGGVRKLPRMASLVGTSLVACCVSSQALAQSSSNLPLANVPGATALQSAAGESVQTACIGMTALQGNGQLSGQSVALLDRCRELVQTSTDGANTLGLDDQQLNGALQQVATEEAAVLGSRSGEIASTRIDSAVTRLTELRRGATGFRITAVAPSESGPAWAFGSDWGAGLATGGAAQAQGGDSIFDEGRWSGFLNVGYGFGNKDGTDREDGYDFNTWTVTGGLDYRLNDRFTLGGMLNYGNLDADFDTTEYTVAGGGANADAWGLTLYGLYTQEALYADALVGYGRVSYDLKRSVLYTPGPNAGGTSAQQPGPRRFDAKADTDSTDFVASLGVGYDMNQNQLSFGPYARLTYFESKIDGYSERGSGATELSLRVDDQDVESLTSTIGAQLSYASSQSFGVVIPSVRVAWIHEFSNDARNINATYIFDPNQTPLIARTNDPDRDYGYVGVGVSTVLPRGLQLMVDYQGIVGYRDLSDNRFVAALRAEF